MNRMDVPASQFQTTCPRCAGAVPFCVFQASFYDFATYFGTHTGTLYRLSRDQCGYMGVELSAALAPAKRAECSSGRILEIPDEVWCSRCEVPFRGPDLAGLPSQEVTVSAVVLPVESPAG